VRERGTPSRIAAVGLSAAAAILLAIPPASASAGGVVEYPIPTLSSLPQGVTLGPDGAVWFAERTANAIGRLASDGTFTEFPLPSSSAQPFWIAAGPDGNLWFTERSGNRIGRLTPAGTITEFAVPTAASQPAGIAVGADGAMWFTEQSANKVGRITSSGAITEFATPTLRSGPYGIVAGPDGAMWFTEQTANKVGRITMAGQITETAVSPGGLLSGIVAGPDGNLWFTERTGQSIVSITPDMATLSFYPLPAGGSPIGIAAGPDGRLWFAENAADRVGAIGTDGAIVEYSLPSTGTQPFGIAAAPGAIWFTEQAGNRIGTMPIVTDSTSPTVNLVSPAEGASFMVGDAVAADYSCADAGGSGLASCTGPVPSGTPIDTSSAGPHDFTITATDGAGNTASVTHGYTVVADETPPTADVVSPLDGASFLVGTEVIARYSCSDEGGSGLAACDGPVPPGSALDTSIPGRFAFPVTATDGAGNETTVTNHYTVFPDPVAPTVRLTTPADGAWFLAGSRVTASYFCADEGGSGLVSCIGTIPSGSPIDTSVGPHTFAVTAADGAGNTATASHRYLVFAGVGGTLAAGKSQAGSAMTLMLDLGPPAAPATGSGRGPAARRAQTTIPSTQEVSCDDPSILLGSPVPADVRAMSLDGNNQLSLTWKTDRTWAGTCRALLVPIDAWGGATAAFSVRMS
jgi:virginiamycin B lyase